jgi:hypothetical protein
MSVVISDSGFSTRVEGCVDLPTERVANLITQDEMKTNPNVASYVPPSTRPPGYSP